MLQTVLIKIVMTSCYTALVLLEGRKVLSEYGMTTRSIYIGLELSENFEQNVIKEKMNIATGSIFEEKMSLLDFTHNTIVTLRCHLCLTAMNRDQAK